MVKILALTNGSPHSWAVVNSIVDLHGPITVLTEPKEPRGELIKRRISLHGLGPVVGQVGFVLLQRLIGRLSQARVSQIIAEERLNVGPNPSCDLRAIENVNSPACLEAIAEINPDVVIVYGTRIIRAASLQAIKAPLINLHAGITPKYRGQAGGYWAFANGDPDHAGVTVHLVDRGVDTGDVLYQGRIDRTKRDNFSTYFFLQAAALRALVLKAIDDVAEGPLNPHKPSLPSRQYYHPTLWGYLWRGVTAGVW